MDAHTLDAARASTVSRQDEEISIPGEIAQRLSTEFSGQTPEYLETKCRDLVQTTARAALELGKCLIVLKGMTPHGEWMPTVQRIGIGISTANKMMQAACRILQQPDYECLIEATKTKTKLFELLVLDDDELRAIAQGSAARGISLDSLPTTPVKRLREQLRGAEIKAPGSVARDELGGKAPAITPHAKRTEGMPAIPGSTPLLGGPAEAAKGSTSTLLPAQISAPNSSTSTNLPASGHPEALLVGDRVRSLLAGRTGWVVKVYGDGSACICWDHGSPQPEGLGHERMPRQMLEILTDEASQADAAMPTSTTASRKGEVAEGEKTARERASVFGPLVWDAPPDEGGDAADAEVLPSVYSMVAGVFSGAEVTLMIHAGKVWMIAEEIAAVLGGAPDEVEEIEGAIARLFERQPSPGAYAKVRIASTALVARLLDSHAVDLLAIMLNTPEAASLAEWLGEFSALPPSPTNEATEEAPVATDDCLSDQFKAMYKMYQQAGIMMDRVFNQIGAICEISERSELGRKIDIGTIADIAYSLAADCLGRMNDIEVEIISIKYRVDNCQAAGAHG